MAIITKQEIKKQLHSKDTILKKSLGQNYLVSASAIHNFIRHFPESDVIFEIGPGIGNISVNYFDKFKKVILVEIDKEKIPLIKENLTNANDGVFPNWVEIVNKDIFDLDINEYINKDESYQIVGALPYNISKKIVHWSLNQFPTPLQCTYILQREVADKYVCEPPNETFLSVSTKFFATAKREEIIKRDEFYPVPKVNSRTIIFANYRAKSKDEIESFESIIGSIKRSFANPRKKLINTVKPTKVNDVINLLLQKRPQELNIQQWKAIIIA